MLCIPVQAKHAKGGGQKNIVLVDGVRTPFLLSGTSYKVLSFLSSSDPYSFDTNRILIQHFRLNTDQDPVF
jgi:hypothetical protein